MFMKDGMKFTPTKFDEKIDMQLSKLEKEKLDEIKMYESLEWDYETAVLRTGSSFGDAALMEAGLRVVTARCLTNCYFAELDKVNFDKIIQKIQ